VGVVTGWVVIMATAVGASPMIVLICDIVMIMPRYLSFLLSFHSQRQEDAHGVNIPLSCTTVDRA